MKSFATIAGIAALAATLAAPIGNAFGVLGDGTAKAVLLAATVLWFAAAPFWIGADSN